MSKKSLFFLIIFLTVFGFLIFNFREVEKIEAAPDTLPLRPNLAGTYQAWTLVGSTHPVATSDQSNTSYVYALNTSSKETENLTDTAQTGTINQVTAYMRAKAPFGGGTAEGANILWRTYNTDYESVAFIISRIAFTDYSQTRQNNPNTNLAWTWTEVNALQVGARASGVLEFEEEIDVSEFWIVVDYTPAGGCNLNTSGNYTLSSTCTLSAGGNHITGGDLIIAGGGVLNVQTGSSLTIDAGYKISISGGTINMQGGQIFIGV